MNKNNHGFIRNINNFISKSLPLVSSEIKTTLFNLNLNSELTIENKSQALKTNKYKFSNNSLKPFLSCSKTFSSVNSNLVKFSPKKLKIKNPFKDSDISDYTDNENLFSSEQFLNRSENCLDLNQKKNSELIYDLKKKENKDSFEFDNLSFDGEKQNSCGYVGSEKHEESTKCEMFSSFQGEIPKIYNSINDIIKGKKNINFFEDNFFAVNSSENSNWISPKVYSSFDISQTINPLFNNPSANLNEPSNDKFKRHFQITPLKKNVKPSFLLKRNCFYDSFGESEEEIINDLCPPIRSNSFCKSKNESNSFNNYSLHLEKNKKNDFSSTWNENSFENHICLEDNKETSSLNIKDKRRISLYNADNVQLKKKKISNNKIISSRNINLFKQLNNNCSRNNFFKTPLNSNNRKINNFKKSNFFAKTNVNRKNKLLLKTSKAINLLKKKNIYSNKISFVDTLKELETEKINICKINEKNSKISLENELNLNIKKLIILKKKFGNFSDLKKKEISKICNSNILERLENLKKINSEIVSDLTEKKNSFDKKKGYEMISIFKSFMLSTKELNLNNSKVESLKKIKLE